MKQISKTGQPNTVLSVMPDGNMKLNLGTDLGEDRLKPFLDILDEMLSTRERNDRPYYGHFKFSKGGMEVTWSIEAESPNTFDLTYARTW